MPGSVDVMAVALLAIGVYVYIPGTYSKEQPLKAWTFKVALPRAKVERMLVHDFHDTAKLWVNGFESVERSSGKLRGSSFMRTDPFDILTEWTKTGSFTWEQSSRTSPLFLSAASRPTAAEIAEAPALDWASEWRLNELSPTETEVVRTAFRFVQHTRREHALESPFSFFRWVQAAIMPMHWMMPLICSNEHELIVKTFVEAAR